MAVTIEIDLATLKYVLQHGLDSRFYALHGCVREIGISPEMLAAIRAGEFGRINSIVGPSEFGPANLAPK